jgi:arsenate reductase
VPESVTSVLFVCDDNAAASIMAEAILRAVGGRRFRAFSAGFEAAPRIPQRVLEFLASRNLPVAGLQPKPCAEFVAPLGPPLNFVISVSERAAARPAPEWRGEPVLAHWSIDEDLYDMFWMLQRRIKIFASLPHARLPRRSMQNRVQAIATWQ